MLVKDLKALLDKLPDDMQVFTADYRQIIPAQAEHLDFEICLVKDVDTPVLVIGDGEFVSRHGVSLREYAAGELPTGRESK